jgi:hypothetical protein
MDAVINILARFRREESNQQLDGTRLLKEKGLLIELQESRVWADLKTTMLIPGTPTSTAPPQGGSPRARNRYGFGSRVRPLPNSRGW